MARYSDSELIAAIAESFSYREALIKLGMNPSGGGNYRRMKDKITELELDVSHFTGQGHLKGKNHGWSPRTSDEEIFKKDSSYRGSSTRLKERYLEQGFDYCCSECGISEWNGKPIVLQLDHINGERHDNRIENLRLLCPNCHSQTHTFAGRNKKAL